MSKTNSRIIEMSENLQAIFDKVAWKTNGLLEVRFSKALNSKMIFQPISIADLEKAMTKLEKRIKQVAHDISDEEYIEFENAVASSLEESEGFNETKPTNQKEVTINKYSRNRKGDLFESAIINGKPYFVILDKKESLKAEVVESINEPDLTLVPPVNSEYLHIPYQFDSISELEELLKNTRNETVFTIYQQVRRIVSKYVDQEEHIRTIIPTNIVFSYFQDRFNTVHYLGVFGGNGNGKSSIGDIIEVLGYRTMNTTDPSPANIFRSLGSVEPGQLTLVMDEADSIDQIPEMMRILKTGYHYTKFVPRVNPNTLKPEKFYTYCSKTIIAEKPPNANTGKGVNDRILPIIAYPGSPDYDIKEIMNPTDTGGDEYAGLRKEIEHMRIVLFCYRLLHFEDAFPDCDTGLTGRNKELTKPYLQLFSGCISSEDRRVFDEIDNTLRILLDIKNEKKDLTLEAVLFPLLIPLAIRSRTEIITVGHLWEAITTNIRGYFDERRPHEFLTEDYGTIYRNKITLLIEKMGVTRKRHHKFIQLVFNWKKVVKTARQLSVPIQDTLETITNVEDERYERYERYEETPLVNQNIEFPPHLEPNDIPHTNDLQKIVQSKENLDELKSSTIVQADNVERSGLSLNPPAVSDDAVKKAILDRISRVGRTDIWRCTKCTLSGDVHFMRLHPCKGLIATTSSSSQDV